MDYSKLKNAELEALLKERSLPHTGKKAEMVSRLVEHDKSTGTAPSSTTAPPTQSQPNAPADASNGTLSTPAPSAATSTPAAAAMAAGGAGRVANPVAVPNQEAGEDPAKSNDLSVSKDTNTSASVPLSGGTVAAPAAPTAERIKAKDAALFSSNMPATDLDAELAKRKARAKKFGVEELESDAIKAIERAKRFGPGAAAEEGGEGGASAVKGLDEALPDRRKRGRGGIGEDGGDAGSKRRRGGLGAGGRGGLIRQRSEKSVPQAGGGGASWMSDKDREAAERRKAKFA